MDLVPITSRPVGVAIQSEDRGQILAINTLGDRVGQDQLLPYEDPSQCASELAAISDVPELHNWSRVRVG